MIIAAVRQIEGIIVAVGVVSVLVVGISHNSASVPLLGRVAPDPEGVPKLVHAVAACDREFKQL